MVEPSEAAALAHDLTERFGLPLSGIRGHDTDGHFVELRPSGLHPHEAFAIRVRPGWRSVGVELVPGRFAGDLVRAMGHADATSRATLSSIAAMVTADRGSVRMLVNGESTDPTDPASWPDEWRQLALAVQSPLVDPDADGPEWEVRLGRHWAGRLLAMTLALAATAEGEPEEPEPDTAGLPEGAKVRVEVNRYERSRTNRALCIEVHGARCQVCGVDFAETYGPLGHGFIHVHHVVPVSRMGGEYRVDPIRDLVPVCPNCHAMLHRQDPPLSVSELRQRLSKGTYPTAPAVSISPVGRPSGAVAAPESGPA